ncbi:MAG: lysine--tRNA ligase [Bacilli bacterium]
MEIKEEQQKVRNEKLNRLKELGVKVYPEKYNKTHSLKDAYLLPDETKNVSIAGRVMLKRKMGKISFWEIRDIEGKMQLCLKRDELGDEEYALINQTTDVGDFVGVNGEIFTTQTGEKTLRVKTYTFLGKALRVLPDKFHGLEDQEIIYRERHLDLITNQDAKERFLLRFKFLKLLRNYLDNNGFIEVETPVLQNKASGATARPFVTHHNALDIDMYMRISPELTLKKLIIGGFEHIYEIARDFRNEGISPNHLQDFTMIEGYSAYWNYEDNMSFLKNMVQSIIKDLFGTLEVKIGEEIIDFGKEWEVITFKDLILRDSGINIDDFSTAKELLSEIKNKKIKLDADEVESLGRGNLIDQLYKKVSRPNIKGPAYLIKHPIDLSPLARANDDNPSLTDRFQLIVNGQEIINGYSELVDPNEQELRLLEQSKLKENGDDEAMDIDYEYLKAMQYGMPPISGWGMGIDRFIQFLTNSYNIKDVVLYPILKPEAENLNVKKES